MVDHHYGDRSLLKPLGFEMVDSRRRGMDVEEGFEPAVESRAVAIVAGPIVPLAREQRARIATPSV